MRQSVLYYPHIEITNKEWLKSALLVWDDVYRIVPKSYTPKDDCEMKQAVAADLVRSINLEEEDVKGIANEFQDFIGTLKYLPAGLEYDEMAYLHPEKIDANLYPLLERFSAGTNKDGFIELPEELVRGYMFFLANQVAKRRNLFRCTDDRYSFGVSPYFSEDANFDDDFYDDKAAGFYSSLHFTDVLPANISNIPMDKIIQSHKNSTDEKAEFRSELLKFTDGLHKCESKDHAELILNDFRTDLLKAKESLIKSQGFMGENVKGSLLTMGVPTATTAYLSMAPGAETPFGLYSIAASIAIGAIASYQDFKKTKSAQENPYGASYLISLDKDFSGTEKYPSFDRYLEEFIND